MSTVLASAPPVAARLRLARVALLAAARTPGVLSVDPTVLLTEEHGERVKGVRTVAQGDGRYELAIALVAAPLPLHPLADRVRRAVRLAARGAGLEERLGPIAIAFVDVDDPRKTGT